MHDIIIVGARCAGAALAAFLGQSGLDVLLIDKYRSPGPTLSTHILGEIEVYERLRIKERMDSSGAPPLTRMRVDWEGRVFESDLVVTPRVLGLRRELLDQYLLDAAAASPHVTVQLQCKVTSIIWQDGQAVGVRYVDADNQTHTSQAKAVVGADGRHSTIARLVKAQKQKASAEHHLAVYYAYMHEVDPLPLPAVEWYWHDQEIVICNPIDRSRHCLALMIDPAKRNGEPPDSFYWNYLTGMRTLSPRLSRAQLDGKVTGAHRLESYIRHPWGDGWVLVGDASAHLHPVSGVGIDNAVCCAELLAEQLHDYVSGNKTWEDAMTEYTVKRDERIVPQYEACLSTLKRTRTVLTDEQKDALDMLCTFPSMVKKLAEHPVWMQL